MKKYPPRAHNKKKESLKDYDIAANKEVRKIVISTFRHTPMPMLKKPKES